MLKTTHILLFTFLLFSSILPADAQERYRVTAQAGVQMVNSDDVSVSINEGNRAWFFGAGVTSRRMINDTPVDFNLSFTQGRTEVINRRSGLDGISEQTDLRYQSLTFEAMRVFKLADQFKIAVGPNLVPQFRTIIYDLENISPKNDRLLSIGAGLSGKISLFEPLSEARNMGIVLGIAARWTNFFIHNARNRQIDGFRYSHLILLPQVGVRF